MEWLQAIVGDKIDKNVRHTYQRLGQETMSLHYLHHFAVLDHVDFGQLSNVRPSIESLDIDDLQLMPSAEDITTLEDEFAVLVSRYIDTYTYVCNTKNYNGLPKILTAWSYAVFILYITHAGFGRAPITVPW